MRDCGTGTVFFPWSPTSSKINVITDDIELGVVKIRSFPRLPGDLSSLGHGG